MRPWLPTPRAGAATSNIDVTLPRNYIKAPLAPTRKVVPNKGLAAALFFYVLRHHKKIIFDIMNNKPLNNVADNAPLIKTDTTVIHSKDHTAALN